MTARLAGLACAMALLAGGPAAVAATQPAPGPGDAAFKALYTSEWHWREAQGLVWPDGVAVVSHLPKSDAATQAAQLAYWQDVLDRLSKIDPQSLTPEAQVDYQIYHDQIVVLINQQKYRDYEMPVNSDSSFWGDLAGLAAQPFKTAAQYRDYISMMNDMPRFFREQVDNMRTGLKRGFTPPKVTLEGRDTSLASVAQAKSPQDTVWYTPFKDMPATIPAAEQAELRAAGVKAIADSVIPAHREVLKFVREDYVPHARTSLGASELPDGRAYYQSKIKEFATVDLTPDQIHEIGLDEMAKIRAEMVQAMTASGFKGDLPAFLKFLRTDPQFYAKTPQELLDRTAWVAKAFDGKASQYFGYLPRMRFGIIPVPADQAPFYTSGRGGPGVYLVNTYDLPSRPLYSMPALTLHESAPGHAFQIPIAMEHKGQPDFRQKSYISAYGEGWALYCERLGTEMGIYHTPYETFGMLSYQAWRAARLVVDTGIHAKGWTRQQAVDYLHDNTALSDHEISTEVDRYISWPGQALSYYLGEMDIWKDRHKAEQALGAKFNIRAFHDTVLELGSVPLPVLDARIDRFIAEGGKGPYPDME